MERESDGTPPQQESDLKIDILYDKAKARLYGLTIYNIEYKGVVGLDKKVYNTNDPPRDFDAAVQEAEHKGEPFTVGTSVRKFCAERRRYLYQYGKVFWRHVVFLPEKTLLGMNETTGEIFPIYISERTEYCGTCNQSIHSGELFTLDTPPQTVPPSFYDAVKPQDAKEAYCPACRPFITKVNKVGS